MNRDASQRAYAARAAAEFVGQTVTDAEGVAWSFWSLGDRRNTWWATDGQRFALVELGVLRPDEPGLTPAELAEIRETQRLSKTSRITKADEALGRSYASVVAPLSGYPIPRSVRRHKGVK